MESFGIWYKVSEDLPKPSVDLHINLWNIEKNYDKVIEPFIDFGLVIKDFRSINQIQFLFPFDFGENDFEDLFDKVKNNEIARLIFNDNCDTSSKRDYHYILNSEDEIKKLIVKLKNDAGNFDSGISLEEHSEASHKYKVLKINFEKIKEDDTCTEFQHLYLRFRIKTPNFKEMIFCNLKKKNLFLESGFISTQVIDLKINKERNVPKGVCSEAKQQKYKFMEFNKIHFLVMDQANNEVSILGNDFIECRKLENVEWNKYLDNDYNTVDVLVYHWKMSKVQNNDKEIKEYGKLVKITTSTTNQQLIFAYICIAIVLGACGNILFEALKWIIKAIGILR